MPTTLADWEAAYGLSCEREAPFTTLSGEPVKALYIEADLPDSATIGAPGGYPFTRGVYPSMYRGRLWTLRQFAGFGTAEETNERFRYLLDHRKIRVVVAKPGLDGHDRGAFARALCDTGMEVIYTGCDQTPEQVVETVIQEDADAVCLSILSGAHMTVVSRVVQLLRQQGDDVIVTVGGTIPQRQHPRARGAR